MLVDIFFIIFFLISSFDISFLFIKIYFVVFFDFFSIKLFRSHDLEHEFGGLTWDDSLLITLDYMSIMLTRVDQCLYLFIFLLNFILLYLIDWKLINIIFLLWEIFFFSSYLCYLFFYPFTIIIFFYTRLKQTSLFNYPRL